MSDEHFYPRPRGVWQTQASVDTASDAPKQEDDDHCVSCHALLTRDDRGLHKKLVNRGAKTFLCKRCLAEKFHMTVEDCDTLIAHFKEDGCSVFS